MRVFPYLGLPWLVALGVLPALAAEEKPSSAPAPSAQAAPFDSYRKFRDEPLLDWRKANERVGKIGGWKSYAREVEENRADQLDREPH